MTEEDIVRQLAANPRDQQLWQALYKKFRGPVFYSVYRSCRGELALAEDLTHEAFERFLKYADLSRFDSDRQAIAFLCEIARNRLKTYLSNLKPGAIEDLDELADPSAFQDEEQREARHDIQLLAADLSPADQELLSHLVAGAEIADIAQKMALTYGAVAVRVHRLIEKIRRKINGI